MVVNWRTDKERKSALRILRDTHAKPGDIELRRRHPKVKGPREIAENTRLQEAKARMFPIGAKVRVYGDVGEVVRTDSEVHVRLVVRGKIRVVPCNPCTIELLE